MAKQEEKKPSMVKVKVIRAFYYGGQRRGIGESVEMSELDYLQWRQGGKVKLEIPAAPVAPPAGSEKAPEFKESKKKEEKKL